MQNLNTILKFINKQCFINNGAAFDVQNLYLTFSWTKKYTGKRFLFATQWICEKTENNDGIKQTEKLLAKLPDGITYTKTDTVTQRLPEKAEQYHTVYEWHSTTFSMHVSASYSQAIIRQNIGRKVVVTGIFDKKTMQEADVFKKRILSSHRDILDPLFKNGFSQSLALTNDGFTDYDCRGYSLSAVNMKPLQSEAQRLGLLLALGEFGEEMIPENEIWFIEDCPINDSISISKCQIHSQVSSLNDW